MIDACPLYLRFRKVFAEIGEMGENWGGENSSVVAYRFFFASEQFFL